MNISRKNIVYKKVPNQRFKRAEPAVDDFGARCWTNLGASDWNVRATSYMKLAVRRRSLFIRHLFGGVPVR